MAFTSEDFVCVYSGGTNNRNPAKSLGGDPSVYPVENHLLFGDVLDTEALPANWFELPEYKAGTASPYITDYRCFYVFNNSATETVYNVKIDIKGYPYSYAGTKFKTYIDVQLGLVIPTNDYYSMVVVGFPSSGYMTFTYDETTTGHISYDADPVVWANYIQTEINSIPGLSDVTVTGEKLDEIFWNGIFYYFKFDFAGTAGQKYHPLMTVDNQYSSLMAFDFRRVFLGKPKNIISESIDPNSPSTIPQGSFGDESALSTKQSYWYYPFYPDYSRPVPYKIDFLAPGEGFPCWVQRNVFKGTKGISNDGIKFVISGTTTP